MCMSMWAAAAVYNLLHVPHVHLCNLSVSVCLTQDNAFPCKCSFTYVHRSSCLHQHYHHAPKCAPRDTSSLCWFFPAAFVLLCRQLFSPFETFKMGLKNVNINHFLNLFTDEHLKLLMMNSNSFIHSWYTGMETHREWLQKRRWGCHLSKFSTAFARGTTCSLKYLYISSGPSDATSWGVGREDMISASLFKESKNT